MIAEDSTLKKQPRTDLDEDGKPLRNARPLIGAFAVFTVVVQFWISWNQKKQFELRAQSRQAKARTLRPSVLVGRSPISSSRRPASSP